MRSDIDEQAAALRARWMAELAAAIDSAQRVAWHLGSATAASLEARELYARLEAARLELEALRLDTRRLRREIDPWLVEQVGWPGAADSSADD